MLIEIETRYTWQISEYTRSQTADMLRTFRNDGATITKVRRDHYRIEL